MVIEDQEIFDRTYAELMKLPFENGWAKWGVFNKDGQSLYESDYYEDCVIFVKQ